MRPVNDEELLRLLSKRVAQYGSGKRLARESGVNYEQLRQVSCGYRRMSAAVAAALGYELRWVRREK